MSVFHPQGPTFLELARQALSSTERGYDLLAPKFEYTPFRTPDEVLLAVAGQLGPPGSMDAALDLCCGTGAALRMLRPLCRDRVVGIDTSQGMLEEAHRRLDGGQGVPFELVRGDVLTHPFKAEFDVATCFGAFGHILEDDQPRFVAQVARALKPGGRFAFVSAEPPSPLSRTFWLSHAFNAAIHLRNLVVRPPFHMYYLNFLLPRARSLLEDAGFSVEVRTEPLQPPYAPLRVVIGTLR